MADFFRQKWILIILQLLILGFCVIYIEYIYYGNIYPDLVVNDVYRTTQCVVQEKKLTTKGSLVPHYRADFLVSYTANEVDYKEWTSGNGLDRSFTTDKTNETDILNQYHGQTAYSCWYSPSDPKRVVLVLRQDWKSTIPLMIPSVIGMIMIYYLLKELGLSVIRIINRRQ